MSLDKLCNITKEQQITFAEKGYLKLPQILSAELLRELRQAVDNLCQKSDTSTDIAKVNGKNNQSFIIGINNLVPKEEAIFKHLLGSPLLLSIAETLCGTDFIPIQDFVVIKNKDDQTTVNWHQDSVTKPGLKTFMIGFYLDPADDQNGALRIIPQSHKSQLNICELQKMDFESINMQAGDALVHDLALAHSSGPLNTFTKRRVVYFEFMEYQKFVEENIYSPLFIKNRTSLIPLAIQSFKKAYPKAQSFEWKHSANEKFALSNDINTSIKEIYEKRLPVRAANYCFDFV